MVGWIEGSGALLGCDWTGANDDGLQRRLLCTASLLYAWSLSCQTVETIEGQVRLSGRLGQVLNLRHGLIGDNSKRQGKQVVRCGTFERTWLGGLGFDL